MTRNKIITYSLSIFLLIYFSYDLFVYLKYSDDETLKAINWTIRLAKFQDDLPERVIYAYEKTFPKSLTNKIYPDLFWYLFTPIHDNSYVQIKLAYEISHTRGLKLISIANQLDNKLSQKQCICAYLYTANFSSKVIGIDHAAKFYYNKEISKLTENECIELIKMTIH